MRSLSFSSTSESMSTSTGSLVGGVSFRLPILPLDARDEPLAIAEEDVLDVFFPLDGGVWGSGGSFDVEDVDAD